MSKRVLVLFLVLGIILVGLAPMIGALLLAGSSSPTSPNDLNLPATYDPAHYGLPPTIAGYKVLAVLTSDNTACMPPGTKRLVLQSSQPNVESYLAQSDPAAIERELERLGFADFYGGGIEIDGPASITQAFLSELKKWNDFSQKYGCVTSLPAATVLSP